MRAFPEDLRVAVLATGGLSHEPGGPSYFWVDEVFDCWFLERLQAGDHEALLRECTLERMEEAGSGGTAELLAWILVLAFTRGLVREVLPTCGGRLALGQGMVPGTRWPMDPTTSHGAPSIRRARKRAWRQHREAARRAYQLHPFTNLGRHESEGPSSSRAARE